ncbi:MAG: type II toxin-antitoxin system RelE family toxin [Candidatus Limnocylindria bacterium]
MRADDLPKIAVEARRRIGRLVEARLGTEPARFGVPLGGSLHGYWKLRVGDYRVVFKIAERDVWILAVLHRRDVYERASRRSL